MPQTSPKSMPTGQFDPPLTTRLGEEAINRRAAESLLSHQSTKAHYKDKQSVWKPVFAQPQISEDSFVLKKVIGTGTVRCLCVRCCKSPTISYNSLQQSCKTGIIGPVLHMRRLRPGNWSRSKRAGIQTQVI